MPVKSIRSVGRKKLIKDSKNDRNIIQKTPGTRTNKRGKTNKKCKVRRHPHDKEEKKVPKTEVRRVKKDEPVGKKEEKPVVVDKSKLTRSDIRERERERTREEKEERDSDSDGHVELRRSKGEPKSVNVKHREVDATEMKKMMEKIKVRKGQPKLVQAVLVSEKDKILMDRVVKKSSYKYCKKNPLPMMTVEEDADFFRKPTPKKQPTVSAVVPGTSDSPANTGTPASVSPAPVDESYDNVPKLEQVMKLPDKNVYTHLAVPFWAMTLEPEDEDMKDVEPPISVGTDHVEMAHDKKIFLKRSKDVNLVLDEFQPMSELVKRDVSNFHTHFVFSNTVRSLINVNMKCKGDRRRDFAEEATQADDTITFSTDPPVVYVYDRSNPRESARARTICHDFCPLPIPSPKTDLSTVSTTMSCDN